MNTRAMTPWIALIAVLVILCLSTSASTEETKATDDGATTIGRFQVSAFGPTPDRAGPGYYLIDTSTGRLWFNYGDTKPSLVTGPMTE